VVVDDRSIASLLSNNVLKSVSTPWIGNCGGGGREGGGGVTIVEVGTTGNGMVGAAVVVLVGGIWEVVSLLAKLAIASKISEASCCILAEAPIATPCRCGVGGAISSSPNKSFTSYMAVGLGEFKSLKGVGLGVRVACSRSSKSLEVASKAPVTLSIKSFVSLATDGRGGGGRRGGPAGAGGSAHDETAFSAGASVAVLKLSSNSRVSGIAGSGAEVIGSAVLKNWANGFGAVLAVDMNVASSLDPTSAVSAVPKACKKGFDAAAEVAVSAANAANGLKAAVPALLGCAQLLSTRNGFVLILQIQSNSIQC